MPTAITLTLNPTIDLTWEVDRLTPTGKNRARTRRAAAGGGGINVARGVRELGGQAVAVHTAGREVGRRLCRLLDEESIEHRAVEIAGETREAVVLLDADTDETYHIVPHGPELADQEASCVADRFLAEAAEADVEHLVISGSLPGGVRADFYAEVAGRARTAGRRILLDTSGPALEEALEVGVFLVKPNKREAAGIIGRAVEGFDDARELNERLLSRGAAEVVVTTVGEHGSVCSTHHGHAAIRTPPLPGKAVSDAGAGDSLLAGMVWRLTQGDDPAAACVVGVAAAAASVLTPGTELFRRSDVDELVPRVDVDS